MNLFIDTNIYLSFYHFSSDDLEQLKKVIVAIKNGKIKLWLTDQVVDEFNRNREVKISDALKQFKDQKIPNIFPQFFKDFEEYDELYDLTKKYEGAKERLLENIDNYIKSNELKADKIIELLFSKAEKLKITNLILKKAKSRFDRGNPPGKNNSYGDAINWELLLKSIPENEELYLVARDKDFVSAYDNKMLSDFLSIDWFQSKKAIATYYPSLSDFFSVHFPDIKLAVEMERKIAISNLASSYSFASTHLVISKLSTYTDFSPQEVLELVDILLSNDQVSIIGADDDISSFVMSLVTNYSTIIGPEKLDQLQGIYSPEEDTTTFSEINGQT